jgi:hypothetical protein
MPFDATLEEYWGVWCLIRGGAEGWLIGFGPSDRLTEAFAKASAVRFTDLHAAWKHIVTYTAKLI